MRTILLTLFGVWTMHAAAAAPNYVLIFCDDLGYGDLGCYGSTKNRTPRIDAMAKEGMRFTSFLSSSPVCTPSRASLLTGCYARRVGMHEDFTGHWVLIPRSRRGMHADEWHLGDQPPHLPTAHGFDEYYGIPYSNDMASARRGDPPLPLVLDAKVIEAPANQATLTQRYTREAVRFIERNKSKPFFLYLPHTFPHLPLFASKEFHGKSANGRYGDSVEEIDWSTGKILDALKQHGLDKNTLVIFTSDNGSNGRNGGSNAPLSGAKGGTMEGGMRVPMIARWPGRIPAGGTCNELSSTMDFLPTFATLSDGLLSANKIDGHDITPLLTGTKGAASPYEVFYYYRRRQLQAVRWGDWKWHLPLANTFPNWTTANQKGRGRPGKLVDLKTDLAEKVDVTAANPKVMAKMRELVAQAEATLGNEDRQGKEQRPATTLKSSKPMVLVK
jgi:arylsulfatase A-like enzyme